MGSFIFFTIILLVFALVSGLSSSNFIYPNFSASNLQFVDTGTFLSSTNGTFKAAIFNPGAQKINFYLCVIHAASNTIIWSANRDAPISDSGKMNLTEKGITIFDEAGKPKWSTPLLNSSVYALQLTEMGNLVLLDQFNGSLWESFHSPTDTIVLGQQLPVGTSLFGAVSSYDLSTGDYKLTISDSDAILQWHDSTYWKLSMDTRAYMNSNYVAEYMTMNRTGLYLLGHNGVVVVIQVTLSTSDFRIAKLDDSGRFMVNSFSGGNWKQEFAGPIDNCQLPLVCGRIELCRDDKTTTPTCSCPSGFRVGMLNSRACVPSNGSLSLPYACNPPNNASQSNLSDVSYLMLDYGLKYFANDFNQPIQYGVNLTVCQDICSRDCSCLGVFFENSSGSCCLVQDELGSLLSSATGDNDMLGYIKTLVGSAPKKFDAKDNLSNQRSDLPVAALVLLPFTGFFLLVVIMLFLWRRRKLSKAKLAKQCYTDSLSSEDLDNLSIPGLPKRFKLEELEVATDNFKTHLGSGGFGAVYKGTLEDKSFVAVKKITNLGIQGKKEFCTEIAVIGNIRHVNLVILRGFCARGKQLLLVYEYMNRGSLDRTLFGGGPVLEWQERIDIACGTARGLAYLHSGCEHKIIHCDVKPENILLHDHSQVKISDFGLSKLLTPEQSSLFTTMRGTRGYLAPEWLTSSAISEKTDVYSFGMVLLELVSGRKNCSLKTQSHSMSNSSNGNAQSPSSSASVLLYFPLYALEMHEQGKYLELADPRLVGRVTSEEAEKLVCVALCCVHEEPALRPNMVSVVGMLEGRMPICKPRIDSLNFLRFYGRRFSEASMMGDENDQNEVIMYPRPNPSHTSTMSGLNISSSYVSSQQISGPR